ncbi:MAG: hypothetical protein ACLP1X_14055 [Polyangiaceae bacterium]|jgi:hypothetical protein
MYRALAVLALATSACSAAPAGGPAKGSKGDASVSPVETGTDVSSADAGASDDADAGAVAPCSEPPDARPDGATCVLEAEGNVEDLSGTPLAQLVMTFCGSQCYGTQSDDAGAYSIPIGTFLPTEYYAIHADGRPDHAVDYLRLTADEPSVIMATMHLPTLPPSTVLLPPDGAPASSVTVGDLTLLVADGTTFDLDIEDYGTTAGRTLRVASVPLASAPGYATAANVAAIYAIAPSGATPSVNMGVILKNSAGLPASAAVEFMVLGDNYFSTPPNVGLLAVEATGHVSADGQTIQTDQGQGIGELTWLAVRKAE